MNKEGKKCVIYIRVSTEMQTEGFSLDAQRSVLKRYAEREGMIVKGIYEDAGKSGKSIEGRPSFKQMLEDIENGLSISYILVYKLSRFGRNAADILNSIEYIQSYDINLIATEEGIDSSQTSGKLLISVLSAVSEIERENILEQTMNGRKEKARQGGWNGGFAPYGYQLVNGKLFIAEDEAEVIRRIFEMYVVENVGTCSIASALNFDGTCKKVRQNGTLPFWSNGTIKRIIDNPVYKGKIAFGRRVQKKVKGSKNKYQTITTENYILSEGQHESIISEELWEKAHAKRLKNKIDRGGNPFAAKHLLAGLLKCPECGRSLFVKYTKKKPDGTLDFYEYGCYNIRLDRGHSCNYLNRAINYEIEPYIVDLIKQMVNTNGFVTLLMQKMESSIDTTKLEKQLNGYQRKYEDLYENKSELEKRIDSVPKNLRNREKILNEMNDRLFKMYDDIADVEEKMEDLALKIEGVKSKEITPDKISACLSQFNTVFDEMTDEEQRQMIKVVIKNIFFNVDGTIKNIEFRFPIEFSNNPANGNKKREITFLYEPEDKIVFLKEHEIQVIPQENKKPVQRLVRSHTYNRKTATYKQIQSYIMEKYGRKVHVSYIAEIKRKYGLSMQADRKKENPKNKVHHPTLELTSYIEEALLHFNMISIEN